MRGEYGYVREGEVFDVRDDLGRELLQLGNVRVPDPPKVIYETKIVTPEAPEVASSPFRDVHLPDQGPVEVSGPFHCVLSGTDISTLRVVDRGRRGAGRKAGNPR